MNTWTPLFSKIVDSSIWSEEDHVVKVFMTLLALKDADHVVRYNAYALGRKCWPLDPVNSEKRALEALEVLASPDTKRIEPQPFEGRRIQKVEDGWLVLNGPVYSDLMKGVNRRNYQADWQRKYRAKKKTEPQTLKGKVNQLARDISREDRKELDRLRSLPDNNGHAEEEEFDQVQEEE